MYRICIVSTIYVNAVLCYPCKNSIYNVTKRPPFVTKSVLSPWRRTKSPDSERLGRTVRTLPASAHKGILWDIGSSIRAGLIGKIRR